MAFKRERIGLYGDYFFYGYRFDDARCRWRRYRIA